MEARLISGGNDVKRERMHILLSFVHRIFDDILQIELITSGIVILEK